jgi:ribosome maturation factor RimP
MRPEVQDIIQRIETLATPLIAEEGIELWGIDFRSELGKWVLRLALDRESGVSLDELARVHRELSDLLDAHDLIPWRYTLEISSPGINRPLLRPAHYRRFCGERVRVHTQEEHQGRRVFVGKLAAVEDRQIIVKDETVGDTRISWEDIRKATVEHDFMASKGEKKKGRSH